MVVAALLASCPAGSGAQFINNVFVQHRNTAKRTLSVPGYPTLTLEVDTLGIDYGLDATGTRRVVQWCVAYDATGGSWFGVPETLTTTTASYVAFWAVKENTEPGDVTTDTKRYCGR